MIVDEKDQNKSETNALPRMNTSTSITGKENKTEKPQITEFSFSKNSFDISVSDKSIVIQVTENTSHDNEKLPHPTDPDQKYFKIGLIVQFLIILKIFLCSVCLFKIQLLGLVIILDFLGQFSVCQMRKKAMKTYMFILLISFIIKFYGIAAFVSNSGDLEYFSLLISMLISIQITEAIEGILLCVFSCHILKLHESRLNEIYNRNCACCKTQLKD